MRIDRKHPQPMDLASPSDPENATNGFALSRDLTPRVVPIEQLSALGRATREHPRSQIDKLARSLARWGFVLPVVIDAEQRIVAGAAMILAAKQLGLTSVPAVTVTDLPEKELRLLRTALNRLAADAEWDSGELAIEFRELFDLDAEVDLSATGFEVGEIDLLLAGEEEESEDPVPGVDPDAPVTTRPGDLWLAGPHRVLCADATDAGSFDRLLGAGRAEMVFVDPPYNVRIDGHVSGLGRARHREFAMASGEMSEAEFTSFLTRALKLLAAYSVDGSIHYVCMDWRHLTELLAAGQAAYDEMKNLCVWAKTNAGMGSLYRSQHELVAVYKHGSAAHVNNIDLGRYGRHRSNVWTYAGANTFGADRDEAIAMHPTVKPVALAKDAILDCSTPNGLILDSFAGSGTTLIAAEHARRRCYAIELDPRYVDVALRRYRSLTGIEPVHADSGATFAEAEARAGKNRASARPSIPRYVPAADRRRKTGAGLIHPH